MNTPATWQDFLAALAQDNAHKAIANLDALRQYLIDGGSPSDILQPPVVIDEETGEPIDPAETCGGGPEIVEVTVEGGVIQHVEVPEGVRVVVHDYDVEGTPEDETEEDGNGDHYVESVWE